MIDKLKAIPILLVLWLANALFRIVSVKTAWKLGECLGTLCYYLMPSRSAIIFENLKTVAAQHTELKATSALAKDVFQRCSANLVSSLKTYGMTSEQLTPYITVQCTESFTQCLENKQGAVLCLAHMGNWEILSKIALFLTPQPQHLGAVYRPLDSKAADDYVAEQRSKYHCQMFPKSTPIGTLTTFIREGGILGVLADQRTGRAKKNNRPFFSKDSARSKLPAVLHLRTSASLFSVAVYSKTPGTWVIDIQAITIPEKKLTTDEVVSIVTRSYEHTFSQHPLDVFWLHKYWK